MHLPPIYVIRKTARGANDIGQVKNSIQAVQPCTHVPQHTTLTRHAGNCSHYLGINYSDLSDVVLISRFAMERTYVRPALSLLIQKE